jgi:pilus assembly protein CpaC
MKISRAPKTKSSPQRAWEITSKITALVTLLLCFNLAANVSGADQFDELDASPDEVSMIKGELTTVNVHEMTRVSITDPDVADIIDADSENLLIVGKKIGQTALFIWDDEGKRTLTVYVNNQNLYTIKDRIRKLLDSADIHEIKLKTNEQEGKVVISGEVPDHKRDLFDQIIEQFEEDTIDLVIDEKIEDLVQIDMQITELNTTLSESLGIDWTTGGREGIAPNYEEDVPANDGHIRDFFKIGEFGRTGQLIAAVNALISEGKARILSKPKLVVISGEEASFLVGGEVPIRTTTFSDTGSSQENVEFKEFGISMTITPTIKKKRVDIIMNLEVSEIDASTATSVSEDVAFSTRSASTHLYLDDAQTIILAGLIKHTENRSVNRIPFISNIPVFGLLFRSRSTVVPDLEQELVIALTPHILAQANSPNSKNASKEAQQAAQQQAARSRSLSYQRPAAPYYLGVPKEMTGYVRDVQERISRSIAYPAEAQRYGWEGTVKVGMLILNDGTLAFALVKESSGHDVFDEVALNTAKQLAPFTAFPSDTDLQELNMTIPIVYSLDNN